MSTLKVDDIQSRQSTDDAISLASDSSVSLKHSASAKLTTTSTGVTVTGTCTATAFSGDGSALTGISSGVTVQEEGSSLSTAGTTLNFVGAGVTASGTGASKTITVPGGGGSLEFVSKTEPSSSVSQIDLTGFDSNAMYRMVARQLVLNNDSFVIMSLMDGSNNILNNGIVFYNRVIGYGDTSGSSNRSYQNQYNPHTTGINTITVGNTNTRGLGFTFEFNTKADQVWFKLDGTNSKDDLGRYQIWGHFNDTSTQLGGVRLTVAHGSGYTFDVGTKILLYKYKES